MEVVLIADAIDGSQDSVYSAEVLLEPNESRPRTVSHLASTVAAEVKLPFAERYRSDASRLRLGGRSTDGHHRRR